MKIVVLDGYTLNPGDLSWSQLQALGDCTVHDRTPNDRILKQAEGAEVLLTNKAPVTRETIEALPRLKYIGVLATGFNIVDTEAARQRGIPVTNVPAYGTASVAQMTIALLLELTQHAAHHAQTVRQGRWSQCPDFCYWDYPLVELDGLTMGIVGYGRIGRATARLALAFGMSILAYKPHPPDPWPDEIRFTDLDTLFQQSDVVSLHCPLTPQTRHLVNESRLNRMKTTAFLLNTSRGPLIDEPALAQALNDGRLAGAAVDVLSEEPPKSGSPLMTARNCLITPHIAWATRAARQRLMQMAVENVKAFLEGKPKNVVTAF